MDEKLRMTERELKELHLCLIYQRDFYHGTAGHNQMMLIAKMATELGFSIDDQHQLITPVNLEITGA